MKAQLAMGVMVVMLTSCASPTPARKQIIHVRTDDQMVNLSMAWAEAYMQKHPNVRVEVNGNGPGRPTLKALEHADVIATKRSLLPTNSVPR